MYNFSEEVVLVDTIHFKWKDILRTTEVLFQQDITFEFSSVILR